MAFSNLFLDELKTRIRLVDVIGKRIKLIRKGQEFLGLCPFHKEKTPSFYVYDDHYHCFGCGAHGSALDFLMNTENLTFPEVVERLAISVGMEIPIDTPEKHRQIERCNRLIDVMEIACNEFEKRLRMPEGNRALAYLRNRGLDDNTIIRFRLGYAPNQHALFKETLIRAGISEDLLIEGGLLKQPNDGRPSFSYFRNRVIFPIMDTRGRTIAFGGRIMGDGQPKYLNSPETPLFYKSRTLYGLAQSRNMARKQGKLIVTEGYMDVIALYQMNLKATVAPLGTALTKEQMIELWRLAAEPILCFDGDAAGRLAAARAAERALPLLEPGRSLRFALLPSGEDPDSLIRRDEGINTIENILDTAESLSEILWRQIVRSAPPMDTPERRAMVWKKLKECIFRIQDTTVRKSYLDAYESRFWTKTNNIKNKKHAKLRNHSSLSSVNSSLPIPNRGKKKYSLSHEYELMAIASLLFKPEIYSYVDEDVGKCVFEGKDLNSLRHEIISILNNGGHWSAQQLFSELEKRGFKKVIGQIKNHVLVRRLTKPGGIFHPNSPSEGAQSQWLALIDQQNKKNLKKQIGSAPENATDNELRQRLELRKLYLKGKTEN